MEFGLFYGEPTGVGWAEIYQKYLQHMMQFVFVTEQFDGLYCVAKS